MFKQRKNKKFNYKPRFSKEEGQEFDSAKDRFASKWEKERDISLGRRRRFSLKALILFLVLLLLCMYILEKNYM